MRVITTGYDGKGWHYYMVTEQPCAGYVVYADDGYNRIASKCELAAGHTGEHCAHPMTLKMTAIDTCNNRHI